MSVVVCASFKLKTAEELRISVWSSDVYSSDLVRERDHRLLERGLGIDAVRIEDVDIIEPHPLEALVAARDQIFAAAADIAVRAVPHIPPRLGRDHQFVAVRRSEEHTSELQSLMRISYAVFCLKKKKQHTHTIPLQHT